MVHVSFLSPSLSPSPAMIIGFASRSQTVSEGDAPPGSDFNVLTIDVATERISEIVYIIIFRHLESESTAIVQSNVIQRAPLFDALFGNKDNDPLEETNRIGCHPISSNIS